MELEPIPSQQWRQRLGQPHMSKAMESSFFRKAGTVHLSPGNRSDDPMASVHGTGMPHVEKAYHAVPAPLHHWQQRQECPDRPGSIDDPEEDDCRLRHFECRDDDQEQQHGESAEYRGPCEGGEMI